MMQDSSRPLSCVGLVAPSRNENAAVPKLGGWPLHWPAVEFPPMKWPPSRPCRWSAVALLHRKPSHSHYPIPTQSLGWDNCRAPGWRVVRLLQTYLRRQTGMTLDCSSLPIGSPDPAHRCCFHTKHPFVKDVHWKAFTLK